MKVSYHEQNLQVRSVFRLVLDTDDTHIVRNGGRKSENKAREGGINAWCKN